MIAESQTRISGSYFSLAGMVLLMLIPIFGDAQVPRCALVDSTGNEIDVKSGFTASEIRSMSMKVVVMGGKGDYRIDKMEITLARGNNALVTFNDLRYPYVSGPSFIQARDRLVVKVISIFLKKPDDTEAPVIVNNAHFTIPIH